jgi:cell wall-associated NlpC family hydrolase
VKAAAGALVLAGMVLVSLPVAAVVAVLAIGSGPATPGEVPGIPTAALLAYTRAAAVCPGLSWAVLAGIGEVESDHGRSPLAGVHAGANAAGAEGPMQMLPATFAAYAAGEPGQTPDPYDLGDAARAAARLLCADGGGDPGRLAGALFAYNHDPSYVAQVLAWAARYQTTAVAATGRGLTAALWAVRQLGKPYHWGATGPASFDCSGLSLRAWQGAGVALPRVAAQQYDAGAHVPVLDAAPGDLVFYASDPSDPATIDHVGLALGHGRMVDAPFTGAVVRIDTVGGPGLVPLATRPG